jgi:hypothetical protein
MTQERENIMTADTPKPELIWANLIHLSFNMWDDRPRQDDRDYYLAKSYLSCEDKLWDDILQRMADVGMNMVIIDVGDGVVFDSHPEVAIEKSWSTKRLREEVAKARALGLEPIPKLNFSTCHDLWLSPYDRMVSTETYYQVCRDLIAETLDLFDGPRFFHLGMDEETYDHQRNFSHVVIRQGDLWWHDLGILLDAVEKGGSRPWVWSDYMWHHPDLFFANMPKSVLQSNWYYDDAVDMDSVHGRAYRQLEERGYDQVPTGSNWSGQTKNMELTVERCKEVIAPERLFGFMQTPWRPTEEEFRDIHMDAIDQVARAMKKM